MTVFVPALSLFQWCACRSVAYLPQGRTTILPLVISRVIRTLSQVISLPEEFIKQVMRVSLAR